MSSSSSSNQSSNQSIQPWWFGGDWLLNRAEHMTTRFLRSVHVQLNGDRPFDIQVKHRRVHLTLAKYVLGLDRLGLGESYVRGEWDCQDLFGFLCRCCESPILFNQGFHLVARLMHSAPLLYLNRQSRSLSRQDIASHYDTGNDLFQAMLDTTMNYSCGYWARPAELIDFDQFRLSKPNSKLLTTTNNDHDHHHDHDHPHQATHSYSNEDQIHSIEQQLQLHRRCEENELTIQRLTRQETRFSRNLHQAQLNKMLMIGRKLKLVEGQTLVDIGCGWGRLAKFLALHFGVHVLAVTISSQQYEYAVLNKSDYRGLCCDQIDCDCQPETWLKGSVDYRLQDYRDLTGSFDRIVSVGMFEHVGTRNYECFLRLCNQLLKPQGLLLLHTIGVAHPDVPNVDPWLNKFIFSNGMLPRLTDVMQKSNGLFVMEDLHNFGLDYCRTLLAWRFNFEREWPRLQNKYGHKFGRIWTYYLNFCAALFYTRRIHLWQMVMSPTGLRGGYVSHR